MKKRLAYWLWRLAIKVDPMQMRIVNAEQVSKKIVTKWLNWIEATFNNKRGNQFKLDVDIKDWYGFDVLKDVIVQNILEGEEVKQPKSEDQK